MIVNSSYDFSFENRPHISIVSQTTGCTAINVLRTCLVCFPEFLLKHQHFNADYGDIWRQITDAYIALKPILLCINPENQIKIDQ